MARLERETRRCGSCLTCQHWDNDAEMMPDHAQNGVVPCGTCNMAGSEDGGARNKATLAVAEDYEGYMAHLKVRADFGCVMHERRPV